MSKNLEEQFFQRRQMKGKQVQKKMLITLVIRRMQIKPQEDITSCPLERPLLLRQVKRNAGGDVEKRNCCTLLVGL